MAVDTLGDRVLDPELERGRAPWILILNRNSLLILLTGNHRGAVGNCYFICIPELGCNQLRHIECQTIPLVKIKPIFQIQWVPQFYCCFLDCFNLIHNNGIVSMFLVCDLADPTTPKI